MSTSVKHFTWLPFLKSDAPAACRTAAETAQAELTAGLAALKSAPAVALEVDSSMGESWQINKTGDNSYTVLGGEVIHAVVFIGGGDHRADAHTVKRFIKDQLLLARIFHFNQQTLRGFLNGNIDALFFSFQF